MSGKRISTYPIRTNPLTVAHHNEQDFIVESILGHDQPQSTIHPAIQRQMVWEPYKALMHVDKLHDYLRTNAMKTLIPWEHK